MRILNHALILLLWAVVAMSQEEVTTEVPGSGRSSTSRGASEEETPIVQMEDDHALKARLADTDGPAIETSTVIDIHLSLSGGETEVPPVIDADSNIEPETNSTHSKQEVTTDSWFNLTIELYPDPWCTMTAARS